MYVYEYMCVCMCTCVCVCVCVCVIGHLLAYMYLFNNHALNTFFIDSSIDSGNDL